MELKRKIGGGSDGSSARTLQPAIAKCYAFRTDRSECSGLRLYDVRCGHWIDFVIRQAPRWFERKRNVFGDGHRRPGYSTMVRVAIVRCAAGTSCPSLARVEHDGKLCELVDEETRLRFPYCVMNCVGIENVEDNLLYARDSQGISLGW